MTLHWHKRGDRWYAVGRRGMYCYGLAQRGLCLLMFLPRRPHVIHGGRNVGVAEFRFIADAIAWASRQEDVP